MDTTQNISSIGTKRHPKRRRVVAFLALFAIAASVAAAAWILNGHGSGAVKVGTLSDPVVSAGVPDGVVYPGGTAAGAFTINNPNDGALVITAIRDGDGSGTSSSPGSCGYGNLSSNAKSGLSISVPAGSSTVTVPGAFTLSPDAPQGCAGATLTRDVGLTFSTP
jgi:hypothetical protein